MDKIQIPLSECHCLNLRWVTSQTIALYDKYLKEVEITVQQYSILKNIYYLSPITVTDLSYKLKLDRTTLSRNVKILVDKNFVKYTIPKGRGKLLELTIHGEEKLSLANIQWEKAQKIFVDKLGADRLQEWNELISCLLEEE